MGKTKSPEQMAFAAVLVAKIFELAADGRSYESIAYDVGVDRTTVARVVARSMWADIPVDPELIKSVQKAHKQRRYDWTKPRLKLATKLIEDGKPQSAVIAELNRKYPGDIPLDFGHIQRMVRDGKLPRATKYRAAIAERDAKVFAMLRENKTPAEIVATGIINRSHLYDVMDRFDGPINKRVKSPHKTTRISPATILRSGPHWLHEYPDDAELPHAPSYGPGVPFEELDVMPGGDEAVCKCRHWIGDPKKEPALFCGRESVPGRAYCEPHAMLAYRADNAPPRTEAHAEEIKANAARFMEWRAQRGEREMQEAA